MSLNSASFESVLNVNRCSKYWGWATENFSLQCSLAFLLLAKRLRGEKEMLRKGCCLSNHQFLRDKIILYAWQTLLRTGSGRVNIRALRHAPVQFEWNLGWSLVALLFAFWLVKPYNRELLTFLSLSVIKELHERLKKLAENFVLQLSASRSFSDLWFQMFLRWTLITFQKRHLHCVFKHFSGYHKYLKLFNFKYNLLLS